MAGLEQFISHVHIPHSYKALLLYKCLHINFVCVVNGSSKQGPSTKHFLTVSHFYSVSVSAVSMTRLSRSHTVSGESSLSLDAVQSHNSTGEEQHGQSHPSISMDNESDSSTALSLLGTTHSNQVSC